MPICHARLAFPALTVALATACASTAPSLTPDQQAADQTWFVGSYAINGRGADPGQDATAVIDINPTLMSVEGAAGCGTFYGSFTLGTTADPTYAGFTIPGRSTSTCDADVRQEQDRVIEALEGTTSFEYAGETLVLSGPQTSVTLIPAG